MTAAAPNFGRDFLCMGDFATTLRRGSGVEMVVAAIYHRFTTDQVLAPPGDKSGDYGLDVRRLLGSKEALAVVQARLSGIAQKDPRVRTCAVRIVETALAGDDVAWAITVTGTSDVGPFRMVIAATSLTVALLEAQ